MPLIRLHTKVARVPDSLEASAVRAPPQTERRSRRIGTEQLQENFRDPLRVISSIPKSLPPATGSLVAEEPRKSMRDSRVGESFELAGPQQYGAHPR